jgi:hypothetical protein
MLEQRVKVFSEALARAVDRRTFIRRVGGSMVAGVATLVMGPLLTKPMSQAAAAALAAPTISCAPPGPYCNNGGGNLSGCRGGHCYQHQGGTCQVYYQFYTTGCWTTAVSGGYWTCCDCQCTTGTCGCASFNPGVAPSNDPSPH